ncbi:MAG: hypothetical protein ACYS9X_10535 [Planctomycetota bacterium]
MPETADADIVDIEVESKRHPDEWVLFEVTEVDANDRPVKGRLLCHSKSRDDLHVEAMKARDRHTYAFFTGEPVPPDMVVVL